MILVLFPVVSKIFIMLAWSGNEKVKKGNRTLGNNISNMKDRVGHISKHRERS